RVALPISPPARSVPGTRSPPDRRVRTGRERIRSRRARPAPQRRRPQEPSALPCRTVCPTPGRRGRHKVVAVSPSSDPATAPPQLPRFGPLRPVPPAEVIRRLPGAAPGTGWTAHRFGDGRGYPNGGIWRVVADHRRSPDPAEVWVKRTGPSYLGTFPVWSHRTDPGDPQWWGREAEFYDSELATTGWTEDVRPAWCHVDDHDGCRDLWLE